MIVGIGRLPPRMYQVYLSSIQEYILGTDVLRGMTINTTADEFRLRIWVVKTIIQGRPHHTLLVLPQTTWVVNTKQDHLLGDNRIEIECTLLMLKKLVSFVLLIALTNALCDQ